MRASLKFFGNILRYGCGLILFLLWVVFMTRWLGWVGSILAFVLTPGLVVFPLVFWIVEKVFPVMYFIIWAFGMIGVMIVAFVSDD